MYTSDTPSRARFSATLRATPPGDCSVTPGLLVPGCAGADVRDLRSTFAPPTTTTRGAAWSAGRM